MAGTKEVKELLDLALTGVDVGVKASADGKIDAADLALLLQLVPTVGPAIDGIGEIPAELADLDAAEAADVVAHVMAKLSIADAHARAVTEAALKAIAANYELVQAIRAPATP